MARSYRKPYVTDGYGTKVRKYKKRRHNKKVRKKCRNIDYEMPDGCAHKHGPGLDPWDVCDYRFYIHPEDEYYIKVRNK